MTIHPSFEGSHTRISDGSTVASSKTDTDRCNDRVPAWKTVLRNAFSFPVLLGSLLVAGAFVVARLNIPDPDTWWHVAVGEQILATRSWPASDLYSFTAHGNAWMAYEWFGEVLMALAARWAGLPGLATILVVLAGTLLLLLYYYCFLYSANSKAAFAACAALLPLAAVSFRLRPQLLGYIFLLGTLVCLERFRQGRSRALWFLPGIFLLWVNTHGTFVFGLLVLAVYWAGGIVELKWLGHSPCRWTIPQRHQFALAGLLSVLALTLTPYGTRLAAYPFHMAVSQPVNVGNINEWQAMPFDLLPGKLFLGCVLLFLLALVAFRPSFRPEQVALLLFAIYASSMHRRFLLLFVLFFAPLVSSWLARWTPQYNPSGDRYALNALLMALLAAGLVWFFPSRQQLEQVTANKYPQQAVAYLRQHTGPVRLLNQYDWGGYLLWSMGPAQKVFIDGRADIYEYGGILSDYLSISHLDGNALPLLRKYGVEACLIEPESPLATLLSSLPDWRREYSDAVGSLFVHQTQMQSSARPQTSGIR